MPDGLMLFLLGLAAGALIGWALHVQVMKQRLTISPWYVGDRIVRWSLNFGRALIATGPRDYLERRKRRIEEVIEGRAPERRDHHATEKPERPSGPTDLR